MGHPEKLADFGYRAVHETRLQSVSIAQAFFGKNTTHNYFTGCSDGGREALMEAQRFADDFDGIIAGAPANNWTGLMAAFMWNDRAPASAIPQSKLPLIQKAVVEQCDALDGVKDGLIDDPRVCHVKLAAITCRGADSADCLTAPQAAAVEKIYSGPVNSRTGAQIHPGFAPGVEGAAGTWSAWIVPGPQPSAQFGFASTFYLQAVYQNQKADLKALNFDSDISNADERTAKLLNAMNPDLRPFKARGGKLIQYHGWGDAAIPAQDSIDYYEMVRSSIKAPVDDFYRLFLVPGMGHCGGGIGPGLPARDVMAALDEWVENGTAPDHFVGTGKDFLEPAKALTRPICSYPKTARYKGSGDTDDAANFTCSAR